VTRIDKAKLSGITKLIFATPVGVTNTTGEPWVAEIRRSLATTCGEPREEIITSYWTGKRVASPNPLGSSVPLEATEADTVAKIRDAAAEITTPG